VAHASAVMDDAALSWLIENRGTTIGSATGLPLAVSVEPGRLLDASALDGKIVAPTGEQFIRKLRRRVEVAAHSLADEPVGAVEKRLFGNVYKGVTDVVTKYVWPWPAFHVTRAASRLGITPNMVTSVGLVLVFVAAWFFYFGELAAGLVAAWLMTFLDTVDGKLARVTVTSSAFGNLLDHGTDIIHPPIWWYCLAHGLAVLDPGHAGSIWPAFWIILGCYVVGRIVEIAFHRLFGFNEYIWKRFDSRFRLIVSRRNIILLIMTVGLIIGAATEAFLACAAWSVVSTIIQVVRIGQAYASRPITSWLY
jgi:phosphatidylglycerophosphate synthase